jgi:hypothetical protein
MVVRAFAMVERQEPSPEVGATSLDEPRQPHMGDRLRRRIEPLGAHVHREPRSRTAS